MSRSAAFAALMRFMEELGVDADLVQSVTASGDSHRIDVVSFDPEDRSVRTIRKFDFDNYEEN